MMFIGSIVLFLALTTIDAQNKCPNNNDTCIKIHDCPEVMETLKSLRPFSNKTFQTLSRSHCDIEDNHPKVCCNQIRTALRISNLEDTPPDVTDHPNLRLLDHKACGRITSNRIIGGIKTELFQYPWMALIAYDTGKPNPEFFCGGTIISARYVLTAAHCVTSLRKGIRLIGVRIGDHDISKERDCELDENGDEVLCAEKYQDFGVEDFYFHPKYTKTGQQNDIALIRLNDTIDFSPEHIKPICLPFGSATNLIRKTAVVTGWGITEYGLRSSILLQASLPVVSNEQCKEIYEPSKQIWYKQLCAGGGRNFSVCNGDSGGPLQASGTYNGTSMRIIQYGLISYGLMPCGIQGVPGVFTNIVYYTDWILNTMRD